MIVPEPLPDNWYALMMAEFSRLKDLVGKTAYYRILGNWGCSHKNDIRRRDMGIVIREEMLAEYREQQERKKQKRHPTPQAAWADHLGRVQRGDRSQSRRA